MFLIPLRTKDHISVIGILPLAASFTVMQIFIFVLAEISSDNPPGRKKRACRQLQQNLVHGGFGAQLLLLTLFN